MSIISENRSEWNSWNGICHRCRNPKSQGYHLYGAKGIDVCDRWFKSFADFLADMGKRPAGHFLSRKDREGDFTPDNCMWKTKQQAFATSRLHGPLTRPRRDTRLVYQCNRKSLREWAEEAGITHNCLAKRLDQGWPLGQALNKEPRIRPPGKHEWRKDGSK